MYMYDGFFDFGRVWAHARFCNRDGIVEEQSVEDRRRDWAMCISAGDCFLRGIQCDVSRVRLFIRDRVETSRISLYSVLKGKNIEVCITPNDRYTYFKSDNKSW